MLKIRQSYHGNGEREGYRFEVYNGEHDYLGKIKNFPLGCGYRDVISINGELYRMIESYDSDLPHEEYDEVVYHIFEEYKFEPDCVLKIE